MYSDVCVCLVKHESCLAAHKEVLVVFPVRSFLVAVIQEIIVGISVNSKMQNVTNKNNNLFCMPASYSDEKARQIMFAYDVWTEDVPGYEGYYELLDNLYGGMKDTRSVDETIDMMTTRGVDDWHFFSSIDSTTIFSGKFCRSPGR